MKCRTSFKFCVSLTALSMLFFVSFKLFEYKLEQRTKNADMEFKKVLSNKSDMVDKTSTHRNKVNNTWDSGLKKKKDSLVHSHTFEGEGYSVKVDSVTLSNTLNNATTGYPQVVVVRYTYTNTGFKDGLVVDSSNFVVKDSRNAISSICDEFKGEEPKKIEINESYTTEVAYGLKNASNKVNIRLTMKDALNHSESKEKDISFTYENKA